MRALKVVGVPENHELTFRLAHAAYLSTADDIHPASPLPKNIYHNAHSLGSLR